ncbi:hypothetical protein ACLBXM_21000 [Xanthobacteraceae bacterium A53D]
MPIETPRVSVEPIERPDIVIPDTGPLIHLSQAGALDLLHEIGGTVVIVDMVRNELAADMAKPEAQRLQGWIEEGLQPGSNRPVKLELTETGEAVRLAQLVKPDFRMKNGGEVAMVEWLAAKVAGTNKSAIILYENGKVPKLVADQNIDADMDVVTTRAFLALAETRGLIPSAAAVWAKIVDASPTTNDQVRRFTQRRSPGGV